MALNAKKIKSNGGGKKHPPVDPGTYPARLVQVIDLGLQEQRPFQGQEKPPANEVMFTYELLDEFLKDENGEDDLKSPRWYSEQIPLHSLQADKAKSTQRYYALDPEEKHEGDWSALVGTPCMVTLVHKPRQGEPDNPFVNIASVSSMRPKEAAKAPELVNPPKTFDFDEPDVEVLLSLPDWVVEKVKKSLNYKGSKLEKLLSKRREDPKREDKEDPKKDKGKKEEVENDEEDDENW